jgi:phosphatidylglycerophosphate synthase
MLGKGRWAMADYAGKWQGLVPWRPALARPLVLEAGVQSIVLAIAVMAALTADTVQLSWRGVIAAGFSYALVITLVVNGLRWHAPHRHFGFANAITLCRAAINALLLAVAAEIWLGGPLTLDSEIRWELMAVATIALLMDGLDGWAARRTKMASDFGARFDVETDAVFLLTLTLIVAGTGIVGPWILVSALIYYAFRLSGRLWPWLAAPLPPSWRRKAICVAQATFLIAAIAPVLPVWASWACCFTGLMLQVYSFSVDIVWLIGRSSVSRQVA